MGEINKFKKIKKTPKKPTKYSDLHGQVLETKYSSAYINSHRYKGYTGM